MQRSAFRHNVKVDKILRDIDLMIDVSTIKNVHLHRNDFKLLLTALELPLWQKRQSQLKNDKFKKEIPYRGISIRSL